MRCVDKLYCRSGGSTRGIADLARTVSLKKMGYVPDLIGGNSITAVTAVQTSLYFHDYNKPFERTLETFLNISGKTISSNFPFKDNGKVKVLRLIWNVLTKGCVMSMDNLERNLRNIVTPKVFWDWKTLVKAERCPECVVVAVDSKTAAREYIYLSKLGYERYISVVMGSASIPIFTPPIMGMVDGGVRTHNPCAELMERHRPSHTISSYLRESVPYISPVGNNSGKVGNLFKTLIWTIRVLLFQVSRGDERNEIEQANMNGLEIVQLFITDNIDGWYNVNSKDIRRLYEESFLKEEDVLLYR